MESIIDCIDKVFASPIFWTFMGLQAIGTGGFIVLVVTMEILYANSEDSPGTSFAAVSTGFAIPVACFCFLFAGAAFFNAFHKAACRKSGSSLPSLLPAKNKISSSVAHDGQSMEIE